MSSLSSISSFEMVEKQRKGEFDADCSSICSPWECVRLELVDTDSDFSKNTADNGIFERHDISEKTVNIAETEKLDASEELEWSICFARAMSDIAWLERLNSDSAEVNSHQPELIRWVGAVGDEKELRMQLHAKQGKLKGKSKIQRFKNNVCFIRAFRVYFRAI